MSAAAREVENRKLFFWRRRSRSRRWPSLSRNPAILQAQCITSSVQIAAPAAAKSRSARYSPALRRLGEERPAANGVWHSTASTPVAEATAARVNSQGADAGDDDEDDEDSVAAVQNVVALQAAVRGYMVRVRAAEAMRCVSAIVVLQRLVRGRLSHRRPAMEDYNWRTMLLRNAFARQLMVTTTPATRMRTRFDVEGEDSPWRWLNRWTAALPPAQDSSSDKKAAVLKNGDERDVQHGFSQAGDFPGEDEPRDFGFGTTPQPEEVASAVRWRYVCGLQVMLQIQLEVLVEKFKVIPLICGTSAPIWMRYVQASKVFEDTWVKELLLEAKAAQAAKSKRKRDDDWYCKSIQYNLPQITLTTWCDQRVLADGDTRQPAIEDGDRRREADARARQARGRREGTAGPTRGRREGAATLILPTARKSAGLLEEATCWVDVFCYRILLSCRLLNGTSRYKELHQIAEAAKAKLEEEVGSLDGVSARMGRSIVGRLPVAREVQNLCSQAIEKADELLRNSQTEFMNKDSFPPACKLIFEDVTSSSLVIVLKEVNSTSESVRGYKLWHWKSGEQPTSMEPAIFPKDQQKIVISNLQPCTEYDFRIISFSENKEIDHFESKCVTKGVEIAYKNVPHSGTERCSSSGKNEGRNETRKPQSSKVRKSGKVVRQSRSQPEACEDDPFKLETEDSCDRGGWVMPDSTEQKQVAAVLSCELDLNVSSVPDLNVDVINLVDGCSSEKNGHVISNGSGGSQTCGIMQVAEVPAMESQSEGQERQLHRQQQTCEDDSTLLIGSPGHFSRKLGGLGDDYEQCVKVIRWLERNEHIDKDFRMKFLTWFSLRATKQERLIVSTFIRTLIEEPSCLAEQLLDSFEEIVSCKKPRGGFCSKLWH